MEDGKTYVNVRRETVVSKIGELDSIPVNYRWSGSGEISQEVDPKEVIIRDRPRVSGKLETRISVCFEKPLKKGEKYSFTLRLRCAANDKQPEPFISSSSKRRVDKLILRVSFPLDNLPAQVTYRVLDGDGTEKSHAALDCADYLTGEYRVEARYPKPFFEHRIEWEREDKHRVSST